MLNIAKMAWKICQIQASNKFYIIRLDPIRNFMIKLNDQAYKLVYVCKSIRDLVSWFALVQWMLC